MATKLVSGYCIISVLFECSPVSFLFICLQCTLWFVVGFIDFIVEPSFQVMGDMLEKIVIPLHQRNTIAEEVFDKVDKATSTTSLSSRPSTPGTPRSPVSPG